MTEFFPTSLPDHVLLFLGTFASASALSAILPLRWGWNAFPLVLLGWLLGLAGIVIVTIARDQGSAWGAAMGSGQLLMLVMTVALAFATIRTVRMRRGKRGGPRP